MQQEYAWSIRLLVRCREDHKPEVGRTLQNSTVCGELDRESEGIEPPNQDAFEQAQAERAYEDGDEMGFATVCRRQVSQFPSCLASRCKGNGLTMGMANVEHGMPLGGSLVQWKLKRESIFFMQRKATNLFGTRSIAWMCMFAMAGVCWSGSAQSRTGQESSGRIRVLLEDGWRFHRGDAPGETGLLYDVRPALRDNEKDKAPDAMAVEAEKSGSSSAQVLKPWIFPSANPFLQKTAKRHRVPQTPPPTSVYAAVNFDDHTWESVHVPHDWAIAGPFDKNGNGGMGRLPSAGVGWYRKKLEIPASERGKNFYLDVEGAMSYASVWINGQFVGGWPYGYASWRVDLTPYVVPGGTNQLAIRLDNPAESSRWYPGGGLYRNVWLVETGAVHVAEWGTKIATEKSSNSSAELHLAVHVENSSKLDMHAQVRTEIYPLDEQGKRFGPPVATTSEHEVALKAGGDAIVDDAVTIQSPRLWGPLPTQHPYLYQAVTSIEQFGKRIDSYETQFGIRQIRYDAKLGLFVNGEHVEIKGVNVHHDLGALGAAFHMRAAERQLEILQEMGCNAIRTSHNPPAPELLDLTDRMGILVFDEIFDAWERMKTPWDFHLIFPEWHEADLRSFIRRDRNHASVFLWSVGNEVGEQMTEEAGGALLKELVDIAHQEDSTRPVTASMNYAGPGSVFADGVDVISLNYQGAGIRSHPPMYDAFHAKYPDKMILSSESAATVSSRGVYLFPVPSGTHNAVADNAGGDPLSHQVDSYDLYSLDFGSSPDRVFQSQDSHSFSAGEFVWSGWDYLGEPAPYWSSRSSYYGIIDLAGFKKDRFYLYQAKWRPDLPMVHILPHWTWPDRVGETTPVHVYTSGDEAELFVNGQSLGRKKKGAYEYRLRWDNAIYQPGELKVVAYKNGKQWATETVKTAARPERLIAEADRATVSADGADLSFVSIGIVDGKGIINPNANNRIRFALDGPGEIVATDNGDPADMEAFSSDEKNAFHGFAMAVVKGKRNQVGKIHVTVSAEGLQSAEIWINSAL